MEGLNKHFSHLHNLNLHHIPEGKEITCSGCNSSSTATVYACWQCNFFLHEQCFRATRSLQHPSHPSHPLTLLPFPTYPSNSFYCNSCNQIGTGFTYCCSNCEFDLHVQCAYSISLSSLLTPQAHILPQQNQTPSFGTPHDHYPLPNQAPIFNPQYVSVHHQAPANQPIPSAPFLNYPIVKETGLIFNGGQYSPILHSSHNPQPIPSNHVQNYPSINERYETVQSYNNPQNSHIPSHSSSINEREEVFNRFQNYPQPSQHPEPVPSNHIPSYPSINETLPSLNAPMNSPQSSNIPSHNPPKKETEQNFNHVQNSPQPSHNTQETAVTENQNEKSESSTGNQDLDIQLEMQRLQLELEMANQMAQMIANMGQSISNLAG